MSERPRTTKDLYGRHATSESRGRTHERVMALQHDPAMLPGAETVLAERPAGSIAEALMAFHAEWVAPKPVTTRRSYERSLALLARDLHEHGPLTQTPSDSPDFTRERFLANLDWRLSLGLHDPGELQRAALHMSRFGEWLVAGGRAREEAFAEVRTWMRAHAASRIAAAPPAYHVATAAAELRDTSGDAAKLTGDGETTDA